MVIAAHEWSHCRSFHMAGADDSIIMRGAKGDNALFSAWSSVLHDESMAPQQEASFSIAGIVAERLLELPEKLLRDGDPARIMFDWWERDKLKFLDSKWGSGDKRELISCGVQGRYSLDDVGAAISDLAPVLWQDIQVIDLHQMQRELDALDHGESIEVLFKTTHQQRTQAA